MNIIDSRETAYIGLFQWLQNNLSSFRTFTRRLKHWEDVQPEDQPALYMAVGNESRTIVRGQPPRITLTTELWVYVKTDENPAAEVLNPLLDEIDSALQPANDGDHVLTLGGLVHHCWIEGDTQIFEGNLGDEAVAIIPVKMLVT